MNHSGPIMNGACTPVDPLKRVMLGGGIRNNGWPQALITPDPSLRPIAELGPGLGELVSIAPEVSCGQDCIESQSGAPASDIVIVEARLRRHPCARRDVFAQTPSDVAGLNGIDYAALAAEVLKPIRRDSEQPRRMGILLLIHTQPMNRTSSMRSPAI